MKFTKMQGAGNDYIYFNCLEERIQNPEELSIRVSDRHFSIGGDGIVMICPSVVADVKMRMFNADGSEGKMCGNAIRCVAKYIYDHGISAKEKIEVETLSGIKQILVSVEDGKVKQAKVDMGKATGLFAEEITIPKGQGNFLTNYPLLVDDVNWKITTVSMGNPHCVVFLPELAELDLQKIGPGFEKHPFFPQQINTEFVRVISPEILEMRVWERGSGETLACGTGACAAVVAAILNGYCKENTDVIVRLLGGELTIRVTDGTVYMTGNAEEVFSGEIEV
jgi:diaminopimelate epimerase